MTDRYAGEHDTEPRLKWATPEYHETLRREAAGEPDAPVGDPVVVQWKDGSFSTWSVSHLSDRYDMADCDSMEGVERVLALGNDGTLQTVHTGPECRENSDSDNPVYYAYSQILTEDGRIIGHAHWSDH